MLQEKLVFINERELKALRKKQYKKQGGLCAITGLPYALDDCVMDHKHKKKCEPLGGPDGLGLCRGVIGKNVNTFEGRLVKNLKRYGLAEDIELPELLRRIADYLESPPMKSMKVVHPKERPKRKKLSKVDYKRVCKYWFLMFPRNRVLPKYPGDSVETDRWKDYICQADDWRWLDQNKKLDANQREKIKKAQEMMK